MPDSNRLPLAVLQACFRKHLPTILRAGLVFPGTPQLPASFALVPQGGLEPHYVTGAAALSQPIPCPRHRAAAYLRVPSVRLSSVTAFRFATAFSPCGGAVIRSRLRQLLSLQEGLFYLAHKRLPNAPEPTTVYLHRQRLHLRKCALFCLRAGSGIPPAAAAFSAC